MAALSAAERDRVWRAFMRINAESTPFTKTVLRTAVDDTDAWIEANQAAFNTALNAAFRTNATLTQKTFLFCFVAMRRAGLLTTEGN